MLILRKIKANINTFLLMCVRFHRVNHHQLTLLFSFRKYPSMSTQHPMHAPPLTASRRLPLPDSVRTPLNTPSHANQHYVCSRREPEHTVARLFDFLEGEEKYYRNCTIKFRPHNSEQNIRSLKYTAPFLRLSRILLHTVAYFWHTFLFLRTVIIIPEAMAFYFIFLHFS